MKRPAWQKRQANPMRPAILEKLKQVPKAPAARRQQAPALLELELPLVAPDDREPERPAPRPEGRGVAVIDFYI